MRPARPRDSADRPGTAELNACRRSARATSWCESGFNLVRSAEAPHIHRNTVVYRMNKIEQITGRSLREYRTAMALCPACLADRLGGGTVR